MTDQTRATETPSGPAHGTHLHLGWALVLISVAQLMVVLDSTIANIALPYIQADLGFSDSGLTWVVTTYALAFGGLLLLGGRLGDLYGRRRAFIVGLSIFAVASLLGGVAGSEALLLASRGLQGAGAALASPAALALITTTFPAGPQRNRAFAVYAGMSGAGAAVGLILGGWLTGSSMELFGTSIEGWRLTFLINVPIGLAAAAVAPRVLAESETHSGQLDVPGAITATLGLFGVVYGLSNAATEGWTDTRTLVTLVGGLLLLAAFGLVETRATHPLLPFRIFRNRTRAASFAAMMLMPAGMFAMFFYLSLYIQNVMGYSPLEAGVAFLPFTAGIVVAAGLSSNLINRVPPRYLAGTGTLMAATALVGFSRLPYDTSFPVTEQVGSYATDVLPWMIVMSLGMGLTFVPLTLTAVHHVRASDSGIGSGVLNTMQQVGGALGLATLATVATQVWQRSGERLAVEAEAAMASAPAGAPVPSAAEQEAMEVLARTQVFVEGATTAFLIGAVIIALASAVVWVFLDVTHDELAQDAVEHPESGVHVG